MSVKIRPYRSGGWEVDIHVVTPDGKRSLREVGSSVANMRCSACTSLFVNAFNSVDFPAFV